MFHALLFEVRGIQRFLFASGKLRDMLAASELLDFVCAPDGFLDQTLAALNLRPHAIPRRAGATFYLVFDEQDDAIRFRAAWRLAFAQWVPGVESVDALVDDEGIQSAIRRGIDQLALHRNQLAADLPRPGPLTELAQRTGLAAIAKHKGESIDRATARLRTFKRPAGSMALEQRFLDQPGYAWPRNFEENSPSAERFPLQRNRLVGVVHADGNGIGQILRTLNQATKDAPDAVYAKVYRQFSEQLTDITQRAAHRASQDVLLPHATEQKVLPARPLVLGGDDMSILVRADLAMDYVCAFLREFALASKAAMDGLKSLLREHGLTEGASELPDSLTASAGICYIKCNYPFRAAYALAEELCTRAKDGTRPAPGSKTIPAAAVAFHKMEGAVAEDADSLFRQFHQVHGSDGKHYELSLRAYAIAEAPGLPRLADLQALANIFVRGAINDRPLRNLATLWRQDVPTASHAYERWRQVSKRSDSKRLEQFDAALESLISSASTALPVNAKGQSPLSDLLSWLSIHTTTSNTATEAL